VKVLTGVYDPDPGARITVAGPATERATHGASSQIHVIHQDLGLVPQLNTVENLDLSRRYGECIEVTGSHVGLILNRNAYRAIATALANPELP
jgi:ABC-type sugar transport system ATPase subunit